MYILDIISIACQVLYLLFIRHFDFSVIFVKSLRRPLRTTLFDVQYIQWCEKRAGHVYMYIYLPKGRQCILIQIIRQDLLKQIQCGVSGVFKTF